jgi:hypothetical protein
MIGTAHATGREGVERGCRPATAAGGAASSGHAARGTAQDLAADELILVLADGICQRSTCRAG